MHKLWLPVVSAAFAAGAIATLPAAAQEAQPATELVLESRERDGDTQFIDARPRGESAGDRFLLSSTLRRGGSVVGRMEGDCVGQDRAYEALHCTLVAILRDGRITLQGATLGKRLPGGGGTAEEYAITGGTGAYVGAAGTLRRTGDGRRDRLTFSLLR